jgi:hypothetical protein
MESHQTEHKNFIMKDRRKEEKQLNLKLAEGKRNLYKYEMKKRPFTGHCQ